MRIRKPIISRSIVHLFSKRFMGFFFFPFIFMDRPEPKKNFKLNQQWNKMVNHESIHYYQCLKLWVIPWVIIYFGHYVYNLFIYDSYFLAYRNVVFEREAYDKDDDLNTLPNGNVTYKSFIKYFSKDYETR